MYYNLHVSGVSERETIHSLSDAMNLNYSGSRTQAQKYKKLLQEQGRSEPFKRGFYYGYDESYIEFIDLYYGP